MIGQTISHYRVLAELGSGGMGVVYRAEDLALGRQVALKFLPERLAADPDARQRFRREAQAAASLDHSGICTVYETGEAGGLPYLAMALIEGTTLKERLAQGPLPLAQALDIGAQVADALAEAHARGVVHRDVKPANIMITPRGQAKVMDFGLAQVAGATQLTEVGTTLGTVAYMSPEQTQGGAVDARTDIWSLGVVLHEMVTGRRPFAAENQAALIYEIRHDTPPPLSARCPGVPTGLERIVARCLAKDPADRAVGAGELASAMRSIGSVPAGARSGARSRPAARRPLMLVAAALALLAAGLAVMKRVPGPWRVRPDAGSMALAILDFRDLSSPDDPSASAGLAGLLQAGLVEASPVRVISPEYLLDLRRRSFGASRGPIADEQALEVARKAGATLLLCGQLTALSAERTVMWRLVDARNGASLAASREAGTDLSRMADRIITAVAAKIAAQANAPLAATVGPVGEITTRSPDAYRNYIAAELAAEEGRPQEALERLRAAVEIDSTFALALYELSRALNDVDDPSFPDFARRAWRFRGRLGLRDRMKLESWMQAAIWGDYGEAIATYEEMLARWPDDRKVLTYLTRGYQYLNRYREILDVAQRGLTLYPDDRTFGLAGQLSLESLGRVEEAREAGRHFALRHPDDDEAWSQYGLRLLMCGEPDSAEASFRRMGALAATDSDAYELALCAYFRGDAGAAAARLQALGRQASMPGQDRIAHLAGELSEHLAAAECYLEAGRIGAALACCDEAISLAPAANQAAGRWARETFLVRAGRAREVVKRARTHPEARLDDLALGLALADLDSVAGAKVALAALQARESKGDYGGKARRWIRMIAAKIALAEGDPEGALGFLDEMWQFGVKPRSLFDIERREVTARAHASAGRFDRALAELQELARIYKGHALAHYELGTLYEQMKRPRDARREYERFLAMWEKADADAPHVAEARARLAALAGGA